ncbi:MULTISPECIES: hypothetical protein [unclassified Cobetia]|uniref:condensin complex protein MksE n=1 Tax=unclassified Cobetia TaxID=2609414 RepID=UPI002096CFEE|nr:MULTISPECIES: hypothetical protein [unclassified Cobetia]MCO7233947.1 hypothetical protein [Cobetia sp. Dlab-2-AX]MCO7237163.1 hypothetical protein [Cobetia sp. Dlab-2-U]
MSYDPRFAATIEGLLKGEVLCPVSANEAHDYLSTLEGQDRVRHYLAEIGHGLEKTRDGSGYYCVYLDTESRSVRHRIRHQFESAVRDWEALLRWLRLSRQASQSSQPLKVKDVVRESEWLAAIENSSMMQEELEVIATRFQVQSQSRDAKVRLRHLLEKLCKLGYLVAIDSSGAIYQATGKWSLLQDQLEFVMEREGIVAEEREAALSEPQQEGLFLGTT